MNNNKNFPKKEDNKWDKYRLTLMTKTKKCEKC